MSTEINWQNLRPWGGSQHTGFEELCCQLAYYEQQPVGSKWERKGAPDAGVECLWIQPDGKKCGWQCKYFLSPPEDGQWQQLNKSVETALTKHSELSVYTVCLPCNRPDPRIPNQKSFMDKWNEWVAKWQGWAGKRGMSVDFRYWDESEICERLAREEHRGRYKFWFDKEWLSDEWFQRRLDATLRDAEPRYSPDLNVELPIAKIFDGLGRTDAFHLELATLRGKIGKAWREVASHGHDAVYADRCRPFFEQVQPQIEGLRALVQHDGPRDNRNLDWQAVEATLRDAASAISKLRHDLEDLKRELEKAEQQQKETKDSNQNEEKSAQNTGVAQRRSIKEVFNDFGHYLYRLDSEMDELRRFVQGPTARLFNQPFLLLHGSAGKGKTHLLCDVGAVRLKRHEPTIVLLGEKFTNAEPWSQILQFLGLTCTRDEFLGALEAAAQARGGRALIFIDALNEGEGKTLWRKYLAGLLSDIEKFPRVGLAVSVRSSYESLVIPAGAKNRLECVEHHGFSGYEYKATRAFFAHYGIALPAVPLLHPEWSDPLFLRLFCQGLKNAGMTSLPEGWHGITQIFNFFLDSINARLAWPEHLDFDPARPLVREAALRLAKAMSEQGRQWLPRNEAQCLVNALLPRDGYEKTLFRHLLTEGVLTEERYPISDGSTDDGAGETTTTWEMGVRFGFERFFDHLHARYLLDSGFEATRPTAIFAPDGAIGALFTEKYHLWQYGGLLEALAVQVPERCGQELPFLFSAWVGEERMIEAFVDALLWRTPSSITEETRHYINEYVIRDDQGDQKLLDVFFTLALRSDHPYNADFLHRHLMSYEMAERDAWWSIYLHEHYNHEGALDRLLDWAQSDAEKGHISDEAVRLCAITLAWCLTTSDRFVRDRATKGLVALLWERLYLLPPLLQTFEAADDPYVQERLLAACYGCSLRSLDDSGIRVLARHIFSMMFKAPRESGGEVWPHILGRDYARGVIEIALHRGLIVGDEATQMAELARPPHGSAWPKDFPDEEPIKNLLEKNPTLRFSLWEWGDFGRYIVDSQLGDSNWSIRRLGEPPPPTLKERADAFLATLNAAQHEAWERYQSAKRLQDTLRHTEYAEIVKALGSAREDTLGMSTSDGSFPDSYSSEELTAVLLDENIKTETKASEEAFLSLLSATQRFEFKREAEPYFKQPHAIWEPFNSKPLLRWIAGKVFDLGWTEERFGQFDHLLNYHKADRSPHKAERIGKKYQWIAFHEIAARMADNFYLKDERDWRNERAVRVFAGPWEPSFRDIDPSFLLRGTRGDGEVAVWWAPAPYSHWYAIEDNQAWLQTETDLPPVEPMIEVTNPLDGSQWLSLDFSIHPREPEPPGEERLSSPERSFWFMLKSYLVRRKDKGKFWQWAIQQDFMGRWMPESHEMSDVFWGELFWAPSFCAQNGPYYGRSGWTSQDDQKKSERNLPVSVRLTVDEWAQHGEGYDCSLEESAKVTIPCVELAHELGLRPGREGEWLDGRGQLVAFDPSARTPGPSTLLIRRQAFLEFLDAADCDVVWTLLGEKQIITGSYHFPGCLQISGALQFNHGYLQCKRTSRYVAPYE